MNVKVFNILSYQWRAALGADLSRCPVSPLLLNISSHSHHHHHPHFHHH